MPPDAKHLMKVVYTKAMLKSWTMSVSTGGVRCETYQLAWLVVTQIAYVNHLDISQLGPYDLSQLLP